MTAGILLSVRAKATRLPGKVFLPLYDGNVTESLLRRLKRSSRALSVVLATSTASGDDDLAALAHSEGVGCLRGSPADKLFRYRDAARTFGLDLVAIVDGDDPFVSVSHLDRSLDHAERHRGDVDLVAFDNLPVGASAWVLTASALEAVCAERAEANTEIWGSLFRSDPRFRIADLHETDPILAKPEVRMTLDYDTDYRFMLTISQALRSQGRYPSFEAVMEHLAAHPELTEINREAQSAYEAHLALSAGV
jgi:spore coat polysaccharide biosynthesis protein SpsF